MLPARWLPAAASRVDPRGRASFEVASAVVSTEEWIGEPANNGFQQTPPSRSLGRRS